MANKFPQQSLKEHQLSETMSVLKNVKGLLETKKRDLVLQELTDTCSAAVCDIKDQRQKHLEKPKLLSGNP